MIEVKPYKDSSLGKKEQVRLMFDGISREYDFLNRLMTLGIDRYWRWKMVHYLKKRKPKKILDLATGTGDLAISLSKMGAEQVIGVDIAEQMLQMANEKIARKGMKNTIQLRVDDAENLSFLDDSFDAITVAFGIRNFEHLEVGLAEIFRVLKKGGDLVILETSVPSSAPFLQLYKVYTRNILPTIGSLFSRDSKAYDYLGESATNFPHGQALNNILSKIGFIEVKNRSQTFGVATIYTASK